MGSEKTEWGDRLRLFLSDDIRLDKLNLPNIIESEGHLTSPWPQSNPSWHPTKLQCSLYSFLNEKRRRGNWVWLHDVLRSETLAADEAFELAGKLAAVMSDLGLNKGDAVHVVVGNHNWVMVVALACWRSGFVFSQANPHLDPKAIGQQMTDLDAKLVICLPSTSDLIAAALKVSSAKPKKVFCLGENWGQNYDNLKQFVHNIDDNMVKEPYKCAHPEKEVAVVLWSSGTTGLPKGIVHTHSSTINYCGSLREAATLGAPTLGTSCMFHVSGISLSLWSMLDSQTYNHVFGKDFSLERVLDAISQWRPVSLTLSSHHVVQLSENEALFRERDLVDLASVRIILAAGAAFPDCCEERLKTKFVSLKTIANIYGQSELGLPSLGFSVSHLGTLDTGCSFKIVNLDTNEPCKAMEEGEICIGRSEFAMQEYLNRPEETSSFWLDDSRQFARTGDLGYYNEQGFVYYVDRLKALIRYDMFLVSPTEIEAILQEHRAVEECLVFGLPDPRHKESVAAIVVAKNEFEVDEKQLIEFVNNKVSADYKKIRAGLIVLRNEKIPRSSMAKLQRKELRDWAMQKWGQKKNQNAAED